MTTDVTLAESKLLEDTIVTSVWSTPCNPQPASPICTRAP